MSGDISTVITEIGKTDIIKNYIDATFPTGSELSMFVDFGLTTVGIVNSLIQSSNMKKNSLLIKQELEKVAQALQEIDRKMEKHQIKNLTNFLEANLNTKMYQFIKTIFQETIDAKSDKLREYCASTIVYAGVADFSEELDYRKLYRCLKIIQELDDLDIELISFFDFHVQKEMEKSAFYNKPIFEIEDSLITNNNYTIQDFYLAAEKLNRLGLLNYGINETKTSETDMKKLLLADLIVLNSPGNPTSVYLEFNRYVHTFL